MNSLFVIHSSLGQHKSALKRHLDRFSRFCRAHGRDRHTYRQTHRHITTLRWYITRHSLSIFARISCRLSLLSFPYEWFVWYLKKLLYWIKVSSTTVQVCWVISTRCNTYISRLSYDASVRLSVRLSVTFVHCGHRVQWIPDIFACLDRCMSLLLTDNASPGWKRGRYGKIGNCSDIAYFTYFLSMDHVTHLFIWTQRC